MTETLSDQKPEIIHCPPRQYNKTHKAVFLIYELVLKKLGSKIGPHITKPYIYKIVAAQTFKEQSTVVSVINKMLKDGYKTDYTDDEILEIIEVLKGKYRVDFQI